MKVLTLSALTVFCILFSGRVRTENQNRVETEHLIIKWTEGTVVGEIETAQHEGEQFYSAVADMLGYEPEAKVVVMLEGPAARADGSRNIPRVDWSGRIHLYRFEPASDGYFCSLAHEMVHAFRAGRRPYHDQFFEEGLAEFVALRVDTSLAGFPWYNCPVVVAAGQWFASGEDIPLSVLRTNHHRLNLPCKAQSYTLRASFFDYLGATYGDSTVIQMALQADAGDAELYRRYFGKDFPTLEAEWREALMANYNSMENAQELARQYRTESPIQYMDVCNGEDDF